MWVQPRGSLAVSRQPIAAHQHAARLWTARQGRWATARPRRPTNLAPGAAAAPVLAQDDDPSDADDSGLVVRGQEQPPPLGQQARVRRRRRYCRVHDTVHAHATHFHCALADCVHRTARRWRTWRRSTGGSTCSSSSRASASGSAGTPLVCLLPCTRAATRRACLLNAPPPHPPHCRYIGAVARINGLSRAMAALTDAQLAGKTAQLRARLLEFEEGSRGGGAAPPPDPGASAAALNNARRRGRMERAGQAGLLGGMPEDVVVEAFAVAREAAHRVLGMRHYDVQLVRRWRGGRRVMSVVEVLLGRCRTAQRCCRSMPQRASAAPLAPHVPRPAPPSPCPAPPAAGRPGAARRGGG